MPQNQVSVVQGRTLSEQEFNGIRDRLLAEAPSGMSEQDFQRWIGPRLASAVGEAENKPPAPEGSATGRFLSNAGEMLNPVTAVEGMASAVAHPVDTAKALYDASAAQFEKARAAAHAGNYSEAAGHLIGMVPLIGPAAAAAGEQIASGDVAGGIGKGAGLLVPAAATAMARGVAAGVRAVVPEGVRAAAADSLAAKAAGKVADVMTPKVGANKTRFAGMADKAAPALATDPDMTAAWSRQGFHGNVQAGLAKAEQALDAAADARLSARTVQTQPLIDALLEKRRALTAEAVKASEPTPAVATRTSQILDAQGNPVTVSSPPQAVPIGKDVVPSPNAARVAQIDKAISELKQLGPVTRYDPLRTMRMAYDGPAKAVYNPSMTQDFLSAQGGKLGAADVTGVLRDSLAKLDPETAKANAQYSLMRSANDALDAVAEVEKTRPAVGRRLMARLTGVVLGGEAAGGAGAVAGAVAGPAVEAIASSGYTTQLKAAGLMAKLSKAIRAGDEGYAISLTATIKRLATQAATLTGNATTSPTGYQTSTAPAR